MDILKLNIVVMDVDEDGTHDSSMIFTGSNYTNRRLAYEELNVCLLEAPLQWQVEFDPSTDRPNTIFNIFFRDNRNGRFVSYRDVPMRNGLKHKFDQLPRYL